MSATQLTLGLKESICLKLPSQPFLKWAGGKSQLLTQLSPLFPPKFNRYYEPFLGGAAVYWYLFNLREKGSILFDGARLLDINKELVNCYIQVRDNLDNLIDELTALKAKHNQENYYKIREMDISNLSPVQRAARFIYLNKTCYNGLYRVNRSGKFNVPMGSYRDPKIFSPEQLITSSYALKNVDIECSNFPSVLDWAEPGDFIYFDPPYAPLSKTASFTSYTEYPFGQEQQRELAEVFHILDKRRCKLMLSNSWAESVINLYQDFHCIELKASRAINSNSERRGKISELLVINYSVT
ncbi:putative adenine specific methyl transferase [Gloeomargarita lithophora Alchichica-D10]|uniref:Site-specific DNA-methyltransferase (adenine-specific) n=1 Tax=Gloeomargarita lithophora Alchichica-D10 TaxID=1188229 RepID=A0A1J0ADD0_9CYAN|nr:DNA adenine methylase [Gloeomargarita lithophora]APB33923.1 putative adenine specific methyl transferase [Gloeomargarita lithophora Alchichica-D10]